MADLRVEGAAWLLTLDRERRILLDGAVAVADGRIVAVGKTDDGAPDHPAPRVISARGKVVTPGLVDPHIHTTFQMSRGLADEVGSKRFLFERMYPYEAALDEADALASIRLCVLELLKNGVTTFIDAGNYQPHLTAEGAGADGRAAALVHRDDRAGPRARRARGARAPRGARRARPRVAPVPRAQQLDRPADRGAEAPRGHPPRRGADPPRPPHTAYGNPREGPVPELLAAGVAVGLGSDHASSGIVDLCQEMFLVAGAYKEVRTNPEVLPPERVLEMATVHGARCAQRAGEIGALEVGGRAARRPPAPG